VKNIITIILGVALVGCSAHPITQKPQEIVQSCLGNSNLSPKFANQFEKVEDTQLLKKALGSPNQGKLCQGQVYKSKAQAQVILYRAWNSTNAHSKLGNWWAFHQPAGKISNYRAEYGICYQWTPLDKLVSCTLKPNTKLVVGTGQSAKCSKYLTYPVSAKQQIYIDNAQSAVNNCRVLEGHFNWK